MAQDEPKRGPGRPRTRAKALQLRALDPLASLSPTAVRILEGARRILVRDGFSALSLSAVADEAGESKASIGYHFGNKDGLIVALVDSLVHEANRGIVTETHLYPMGEERLRILMEGELRIIQDQASFVALLEILPYAMREESLRTRIADLYVGYRDTVLRALDAQDDPNRAALASFASLTIAVVDGLSIQHSLDPARVDVEAAALLWLKMARCLLSEIGLVDIG